jgi:predicted esterase
MHMQVPPCSPCSPPFNFPHNPSIRRISSSKEFEMSAPSPGTGFSASPPPTLTDPQVRFPPPLIFPSAPNPTSALIFLHGRGDKATEFSKVFALYSPDSSDTPLFSLLPNTKLIFPSCSMYTSWRHKCRLHQWFDIIPWDDENKLEQDQLDGLRECVEYVHSVIQETIDSGIPAERIFLGGISQGGGAAILALLTGRWKLGGLLCVSQRMLWSKEIREEIIAGAGVTEYGEMDVDIEAPKEVRIQAVRGLAKRIGLKEEDEEVVARVIGNKVWVGHADDDNTVDFDHGLRLLGAVKALGMDATFVRYTDVGHWYKVPEEIDDMVEFMRECGLE